MVDCPTVPHNSSMTIMSKTSTIYICICIVPHTLNPSNPSKQAGDVAAAAHLPARCPASHQPSQPAASQRPPAVLPPVCGCAPRDGHTAPGAPCLPGRPPHCAGALPPGTPSAATLFAIGWRLQPPPALRCSDRCTGNNAAKEVPTHCHPKDSR